MGGLKGATLSPPSSEGVRPVLRSSLSGRSPFCQLNKKLEKINSSEMNWTSVFIWPSQLMVASQPAVHTAEVFSWTSPRNMCLQMGFLPTARESGLLDSLWRCKRCWMVRTLPGRGMRSPGQFLAAGCVCRGDVQFHALVWAGLCRDVDDAHL